MSDDSGNNHAYRPTADDVSTEDLLPPTEVQQRKLCGYLNKQTGVKGLKKWISRYCVFSDEECKLYLYNSKTDSTCSGCIDISVASFIYDVDCPSQFSIVTGRQDHVMQAHNEEAMMYWLTQLQRKRHQFSENRKKSQNITLLQETSVGLVGVADKGLCDDQLPAPDYIQEPIAGCDGNKQSPWKSFKFSSLKLPVRNPFPSLLSHSPSLSSTRTSSHSSNHTSSHSSSHTFTNDPVPEEKQDENPEELLPRQQNKRTNFDWLKNITGRSCEQCVELQTTIDQLEKELTHRKQELLDKDQLNNFLQEQIRDQDLKGKVFDDQSSSQSNNQDDIDKNKSLLVLQQSLDSMSVMKSNVDDELREAQHTVAKLQEEILSYREIIKIKDDVVMEISNQLADLTAQQQNTTATTTTATTTAATATTSSQKDGAAQCYSEIEKLREAVEAYKEKNMFLANEVLEMNRLRSDDAEMIAAKSRQNDELQTELTRVQSRYLILLEEMKKPRPSVEESPINPELVHRMLEDAMESIETSNGLESSNYYDSYGFSHKHLLEDSVAVESVSGMVNQQLQLLQDTGASKRIRWLQYMNDHPNCDFQRTKELKQMIREGIPANYRCKIWNWCIKCHLGREYVPNKYRSLLEGNVNRTSVALNQIELDLLRTLPNNCHYHNPDDKGIVMLRRVLVAFSWYKPDVGYCQGLNRLAAIALLFLDEEMAFWYLVTVVEHFMPDGYYGTQLVASQADQRVLKELIVEKLPRLSAHIDNHKLDYSPVTFNWFLTVYVDTVPTETMLQIWDSFIYEGSKVLFRYAIALFRSNEEQLLKLDSHSALFNQLRRMGKLAYDPQRLSQFAFRELGSFPMRVINQKRILHMRQVEAEQQEVSKQRERYHKLSQRRHHSDSSEQTITNQS